MLPAQKRPLPVAAAVVHAAVGLVGLDLVDGLDRAGLRIEEAEAAVEGDHHAALLTQHQRARLLVHWDLLVLARAWREPTDRLALDVEPVEPLIDGAPDRALAELVPAIDHARDLCHRSCPRWVGAERRGWVAEPRRRQAGLVGAAGFEPATPAV